MKLPKANGNVWSMWHPMTCLGEAEVEVEGAKVVVPSPDLLDRHRELTEARVLSRAVWGP
jgi:hypothetical protein